MSLCGWAVEDVSFRINADCLINFLHINVFRVLLSRWCFQIPAIKLDIYYYLQVSRWQQLWQVSWKSILNCKIGNFITIYFYSNFLVMENLICTLLAFAFCFCFSVLIKFIRNYKEMLLLSIYLLACLAPLKFLQKSKGVLVVVQSYYCNFTKHFNELWMLSNWQ